MSSTASRPFGIRLAQAATDHGPLCVGIDPHPHLLRAWGLDDTTAGLERFSLTTLEALASSVAAVKPQLAFFERHGSAGLQVLERVVAEAREAGVLCILDAKRGDIGSTMAAYADAYVGDASPLAADAVTASPYLGFGSLDPLLDLAASTGRGVFVLALTSNREAPVVQHAQTPPGTGANTQTHSVAAHVVDGARTRNSQPLAAQSEGASDERASTLGSVGLVIGGTVGDAPRLLNLDLASARGPLLIPGLGAQGATAEDIVRAVGPEACALGAVFPSASRDVLVSGPDITALRDTTRRISDTCRLAISSVKDLRG